MWTMVGTNTVERPGGDAAVMRVKGTSKGLAMAIYAVDLAGRERVVARPPGDQEIQDISPDGEVLLTHWHGRRTILARGPGDTRDRDLSWFEWPALADLSDDGTTILFTEQGEEAGSLSDATYIRKMDGSPAVRLGDGMACVSQPPTSVKAISSPTSDLMSCAICLSEFANGLFG